MAGDSAAATEAAVWEWENLLDCTIDEEDPWILFWGSSEDGQTPTPPLLPPQPTAVEPSSLPPFPAVADGNNRVRKRDPRVVCPNYLAGRVPCACPEMDEMELEVEDVVELVAGGRKRAKTGGAAATARCQVPACQADIRELKGYHRRHRVCLRCANASSVVLDGEPRRYCQQCGK